MDRLLQFLTSESPLAWLIAGAILGLLALIVIVGLVQGREISFWPPQLGPRPGSIVPSGQQPQASATGPLWVENSRTVDERTVWLESAILVVGVQYSPKFFKDFFDVIRSRSRGGKTTLALVMRPEGPAAQYLSENTTSTAKVTECVQEIGRLLKEADEGRGYVRVKMHDCVMRYSFIRAEEHIWVKFFGSSQRSVQFWSVSMANKSSIVSDLHGWRTPSVSGEELQAPGKSGPQ